MYFGGRTMNYTATTLVFGTLMTLFIGVPIANTLP